jgi:ribonuclease R
MSSRDRSGGRSTRDRYSDRQQPRERPSGKDEGAPPKRGPRRREDGGQVCTVERQGKVLIAEPFFARGERRVINAKGIIEGSMVLVVAEGPTGKLRMLEQLGDPDVAADVIAALLRERDYQLPHDDDVLKAADAAIHAPDRSERKDLRELATFTIDPVTAKDFDDAISAEARGKGATVWVHIADVTSFAERGGLVDRAGRARATSTYVPGLVVPMLPPQLADDACSLVPGVDRRAVTVEMQIEDGLCVRAEVYRSQIRSDCRLHYDQVDWIFDGKEQAEDPWKTPLAVARQVARDLIKQRPQALELDIPEPEFKFAPDGSVESQRASEQTESHKLIEQLMVLANEQVARMLQATGAPGLFRIHELPEAEAAERLVEQLASLGVHTPPVPEVLGPKQAAAVVAECSKEVGAAVRGAGQGHLALPLLILRALKQASYSPVNLGHAGLGLTHYCHFTSPIRRYPDIVCHRAVLQLVEEGKALIGTDLTQGPPPPGYSTDRDDEDPLSILAQHCSDQERASMAAEREADRIAKAFLLRDHLRQGGHGTVWRGEVTGMIQAGLFVNFGGGFDGMIPLRSLKGDWWEMNSEGTMLVAERSGGRIQLGDVAEVMVDRVDTTRGKVDLVPLNIGGPLR